MKKYVALLRGINVGGNNKVEMKKLREVFESLGFSSVSTYINSGNVVFASSEKVDGLSKKIEKALEKTFGFAIRVVVRDAKNIQALIKKIPSHWKNDSEQRTDVLFLWDEFNKKTTLSLIVTTKDIDSLLYIPGAIVWNMKRSGYNKSGMRKFIGTLVYKNMTARNINTVRKLSVLLK